MGCCLMGWFANPRFHHAHFFGDVGGVPCPRSLCRQVSRLRFFGSRARLRRFLCWCPRCVDRFIESGGDITRCEISVVR